MAGERRPPAVARVLERVTKTAREHRMFEPGSSVLVAVSGGPDSVCLLHSLVRLRRLLRVRVACFHFDHGLREDSALDAAYVRRQADRLGVPFVTSRADSLPSPGESPEAWARAARYAALSDAMQQVGASRAAVGHTLDDRAETVVLALLRGGGLEALSGMRPVRGEIVRPLIETTREETEAFCRALHLRPRRDPMNSDPRYLRAAIRLSVIPEAERASGREVKATLARTAGLLAEDADLLDTMAKAAAEDLLSTDRGDVLIGEALTSLPGPIASRVVRFALMQAGALIETQSINRVRMVAAAREGSGAWAAQGFGAQHEKGYVRIFRLGRGGDERPF